MKSTIIKIWTALASIGCLISSGTAQTTETLPFDAPPIPGGAAIVSANGLETAPISTPASLASETARQSVALPTSQPKPVPEATRLTVPVTTNSPQTVPFIYPTDTVPTATTVAPNISGAPTTTIHGGFSPVGAGVGGDSAGCDDAGCSDCDTGGCADAGCSGCDDPGCSSLGGGLLSKFSGCDTCGSGSCSGCGGLAGFGGGGHQGIGGLTNALGGGLGNLLNFGANQTCQPSRIWTGSEYLVWWGKRRHIPALVTGANLGTPENVSGVLGQPTTSTLFGDREVGDESNTGIRFNGGMWLDTHQIAGVGFSVFTMDMDAVEYSNASQGGINDPILARPFFNSDPGVNGQDALVLAHPNLGSGSVSAAVETDIQGGDIFGRYLLYSGYCNRVDLIAGYHHTDIDDRVRVNHSIVSNGGAYGPAGTLLVTQDSYSVDNDFNGGEIGLMTESSDGRLTWSLLTKISFGNMRQKVAIEGSSSTTLGTTANFDYGLLTLPSNIGTYERDEFAIVPELNLSVGYNLSGSLRATVGYSFIYWSEVLLAQQTIETLNNGGQTPVINPTQVTGGLVGANQPVFVFPESQSFWLQGLNFGIHGKF